MRKLFQFHLPTLIVFVMGIGVALSLNSGKPQLDNTKRDGIKLYAEIKFPQWPIGNSMIFTHYEGGQPPEETLRVFSSLDFWQLHWAWKWNLVICLVLILGCPAARNFW